MTIDNTQQAMAETAITTITEDFPIDLGAGVRISWDADGGGLLWWHPRNTRQCAAMFLRFMPDSRSTGHRLMSGDPTDQEHLTIGGSLLCPFCGCHGFIQNGKWVPA